MKDIPVNEPLLDGNEGRYLLECIRSGWISSEGPFVAEFEKRMSALVGRKHGIAVCNGSAALECAIAALGISYGDQVIMPALTIISCATAVVRAGAVPVLVDSDPNTWNMNVEHIEARITPQTKAILVVHLYGLPVDMEPVIQIASRHGLAIIEDAAEMHGQTYRSRPCGSFGAVSTLSFYPNKLVTTGEGGMVLSDDETLAARLRALRNLCFQQGAKRFVHEELGWNMRMSNLQAALGVAQVERLAEFVKRKRRMGNYYTELLRDAHGIQLPLPATAYAENIYWVYGIVLNDDVPIDAEEAMRRLAERHVGTRPFFWPIHEQPVLRRLGLVSVGSYPVAERLARRGFYLPSGLGLTDEQIEMSASALREILT